MKESKDDQYRWEAEARARGTRAVIFVLGVAPFVIPWIVDAVGAVRR